MNWMKSNIARNDVVSSVWVSHNYEHKIIDTN